MGETEAATLWARVARGYKAGGFNPSLLGLPEAEDRVGYAPEYLWNYEVGTRLIRKDGRGWLQGSLFLQDRTGEQLKIPQQFRVGDPTTFVFLPPTGSRGGPPVWNWKPPGNPGEGWPLAPPWDYSARKFASSVADPNWRAGNWPTPPLHRCPERYLAGWSRVVCPGGFHRQGDYSIDYCQALDCNDPRTGSFQQLDLRAGRAWGAWSVEVWCRNALDEFYATRGFLW